MVHAKENTHILVANASGARCYQSKHLGYDMDLVKEFVHPENREKGLNLETDRPGHFQVTNSSSRGTYEPHHTPHEIEMDHFAHNLALELNDDRTKGHYDQLIIIAPAHFYGLLHKHCNDKVNALVAQVVEKDYTKMSEKELLEFLKGLPKQHC